MSKNFGLGLQISTMEACGSDEWQIDLHEVNHFKQICLNTCGCSDHSVDCTWFDLDRRSGITFRHPGMCLAFKVIW